MNKTQISNLVAAQIHRIEQSDLVHAIQSHLVEPREDLRAWDYGKPGEQFSCWIVVEHASSNTAIAYCEQGFGPSYPWGLLFINGPHLSLGPDSGWFSTLEDAARDSKFWDGENPKGFEVS